MAKIPTKRRRLTQRHLQTQKQEPATAATTRVTVSGGVEKSNAALLHRSQRAENPSEFERLVGLKKTATETAAPMMILLIGEGDVVVVVAVVVVVSG